MTISNLQSVTAGLAPESDSVISGVAVGVGDITRGLSGDRKVWQAEQLREAADSLVGTPVNPLHSQADVGEVVRAGFDPERGVVYEAELEDPSLAEQVAKGQLEVSIEARHADGGTVETDQGEAMLATDIQFTGMAMVQHGAAPSATASPGEAAALSPAAIRGSLQRSCLAEVNGETVDLTPPEAVANAAEAAQDAKAKYDTLSDCGTGVGDDRAETIVTGDLTPEDFTTGGEHETAIPDYLDSHSDDVSGIDEPPTEWGEETWTDGCGPVQYALWGGTATGTGLEWAQETADAVESAMDNADMAKHYDKDADLQEVPEEYRFDNPGEAVAKAEEMGVGEGEDLAGDEMIHSHGEGDDAVFMPFPTHEALVTALSEMGALMPDPEFSEGDLVEWETSEGSNGTGRVAAVVTDPGATVSAEGADVTREATEDEAAYKLDNWVGPEAGYDEGVVVKSASEMAGEWDDAPEAARMAAADTDDAVSPERGPAEVSTGGEPADCTDTEPTALNPTMSDTEEEFRAKLQQKDERIAELETKVEQLEDERDDVAHAYAEALAAGDTILDAEDFAERYEVGELADMVDETESATLADTEPDVQSGDDPEADEGAALSADAAERIEAIQTKLDHAEAALPDSRVEDLRDEAATLAGTDSYEAALEAI